MNTETKKREQKIRIRLKAFDERSLDQSTKKIVTILIINLLINDLIQIDNSYKFYAFNKKYRFKQI